MEKQDKIRSVIDETISDMFGYPISEIEPESELFADLGLDDLDKLNLLVDMEQHFNINVYEDVWMDARTVEDLYNIISQHI